MKGGPMVRLFCAEQRIKPILNYFCRKVVTNQALARYRFMRYIYILIALGISYGVSSQTPRYITLGQSAIPKENACLVIRQNAKVLQKMREQIAAYQELTMLKLVGFNEGDEKVDSALALLKPMKHLKTLIFEDCDLSVLETPLTDFTELEAVSLFHTPFFENSFFPLLKGTAVKTLSIQSPDPELMTDSLYLLPVLSTINISSGDVFTKPNYAPTLQLKTADGVRNIAMAYFGDHYKANETGVVSVKTNGKYRQKASASATTYPCIRQPIPGIDINDTTFVFDASKTGSFTYESGTTLNIDRQAFLTENGQKYNGEVTVFYREFRNPVEIMLSGIPMTNKVAGETQVFKSGGMYEINAYGQNNEPLQASSDTAIKINFALTDTSQSFQFFSLNPNGSWTTTDQKITTTPVSLNNGGRMGTQGTRAVREYYQYMNGSRAISDTMRYEARFRNKDYLYTYRKDNMSKNVDNSAYEREFGYGRDKHVKAKALFRLKYHKQTKEKDKNNKEKHLVFNIVPYRDHVAMPSYVTELIGKEFMYTGNLSKEQFKRVFNRRVLCWDLRPELNGDELTFTIKTNVGFVEIQGKVINLNDDRTYSIPKRGSYVLNQKMTRLIRREARSFDRKGRFDYKEYNDANQKRTLNREADAFVYCKEFQNKEEKPMNFEEWKKYASAFASLYVNPNAFQATNELGSALVKSGLGFKNIDCYIHSGQMQDVFVRYNNVNKDSLNRQFNTILFKSINTNYMLAGTDNGLVGYYFKHRPNYIIRFSEKGMMQVTKPDKASVEKSGNIIALDYTEQYDVKGMDSNALTRLILN
jgi:hypothetical protein